LHSRVDMDILFATGDKRDWRCRQRRSSPPRRLPIYTTSTTTTTHQHYARQFFAGAIILKRRANSWLPFRQRSISMPHTALRMRVCAQGVHYWTHLTLLSAVLVAVFAGAHGTRLYRRARATHAAARDALLLPLAARRVSAPPPLPACAAPPHTTRRSTTIYHLQHGNCPHHPLPSTIIIPLCYNGCPLSWDIYAWVLCQHHTHLPFSPLAH